MGSGPAVEPARRGRHPLRLAERDPGHGDADRRPGLQARSLAGLGKTAGRLFALSTAGGIAGTFVTALSLMPEIGTNQLLGMLATGLFIAAGLVALGERMLLTGAVVAALVAASVAATFSLAPDEEEGDSRRSSRAELVAALP